MSALSAERGSDGTSEKSQWPAALCGVEDIRVPGQQERAGGPSPGTRTRASCLARPAASACNRRASDGASRNTTCRPSNRRPTVPVGSERVPGCSASRQRCAASTASIAGISPLTQSAGSGRAQQGQHGFLNAGGRSRRGRPAASSTSARSHAGPGALPPYGRPDPRMHAGGRRQHSVKLDVFSQPCRVGTQERLDERSPPPPAGSSAQAIAGRSRPSRQGMQPDLLRQRGLNSRRSTAGGTVATWAPSLAASTTCIGLRTEATSTSVLKYG